MLLFKYTKIIQTLNVEFHLSLKWYKGLFVCMVSTDIWNLIYAELYAICKQNCIQILFLFQVNISFMSPLKLFLKSGMCFVVENIMQFCYWHTVQ